MVRRRVHGWVRHKVRRQVNDNQESKLPGFVGVTIGEEITLESVDTVASLESLVHYSPLTRNSAEAEEPPARV